MRLGRVALVALFLPLVAACTDSTGAAASPVGAWGDTTDRTQPSLVLADDGGLSGTDGCNRLMGSWTADGTTVTFSPLASTMMYCEGVDTWLLGAATAELTGDSLVIRESSGATIGILERSEG